MELNDVFGVSSSPVASYVSRVKVDDAFKSAIGQGRHIVVYGASKQGKTALVSRYLDYSKNVVIRLEPATTLEDIYSSILRDSRIEIEVVRRESSGSAMSAKGGVEAKATIFGFGGGGVTAEAGLDSSRSDEREFSQIPFNLSLAQSVVELLRRVDFDKKVVLENFHYLSEEQQRRLAFALRSFEEMGVVFVILGVWRERDKLRNYCGDLTDRLLEVPVEPWENSDFYEVAKKGAALLCVDLAPAIIGECAKSSFGSIGVFQELMKETFRAAGVERKGQGSKVIEDIAFPQEAIKIKSVQYGAVHARSLNLIASGHVSHIQPGSLQPLVLPYYMVRAILRAGIDFSHGMTRAALTGAIKSEHHRPEAVRSADMSNLLNKISLLQCKKGISPPILDYDYEGRTIFAVDSTFFFFLRNCNLSEFLEEMINPLDCLSEASSDEETVLA